MPPPFLSHELLSDLPQIAHGFFTRAGGVSKGLYDSLNLGQGSDDDPLAVLQNRCRVAKAFGYEETRLSICYQVHGSNIHILGAPFGNHRPKADGLITQNPGLICGVLTADCAPVLFADEDHIAVAAVHAGWKGARSGVLEAAVQALLAQGVQRHRLRAVIGPCIAKDSYEVGPEFLADFEAADKGSVDFFSPKSGAGKYSFDLPGYILSKLQKLGIEKAAWMGQNTYSDPRFFSNRRSYHEQAKDYGRQVSVILKTA